MAMQKYTKKIKQQKQYTFFLHLLFHSCFIEILLNSGTLFFAFTGITILNKR